MHDTTNRRRTATLSAAVALLSLVLACAVGSSPEDVPPQGWWQERGPVVPHDSFPADCSLCHEGSDWRTIRADFAFDHAAETGYVLEGRHATAECLRCHNDRGPAGAFARQGCAGCHEDIHRGKLGKRCDSCHEQLNWRPKGQVEAHNRTRLPLIGAHAAAACWSCHPGAQVGNFDRTPTECVACHEADLAAAKMPDHVAMGWVADCDRCHIPTTWTGAGFNHGTWPLTGAHTTAQCTDCHVGGVFAGTPTQCVDCHLTEYQSTTSPDHQALAISTQCQNCHNTFGWSGAIFDHAGITSGCVMCHLADYNGTNDPDHTAAGFPTSCEACHNTSTWFGATFSHTFPITSGKHAGLDCSDCHTTPSNFMLFSCIDCHAHTKADMDDKHSETPGYVWTSSACLSCHPTGNN